MIGILNYGLGNVKAILNLYNYHRVKAKLINSKNDFDLVERLILPGVGSFDNAIKLFSLSGMRDEVEKFVLEKKMPILGICVGMQILGFRSEEGNENGLNWINGEIRKINFSHQKLPLPHIGWNEVSLKLKDPLFENINDKRSFYFVHSYKFQCDDEFVVATTNYGQNINAAVQKGNVFGVQFHPERSQKKGLYLINNFVNYIRKTKSK